MVMNEIAVPTYVPTRSGLFRFLIPTAIDHAACHECLVNSLGCAKLYLLQVEEKLRLYWVEGLQTSWFRFWQIVTVECVACSRSVILQMAILLSPKWQFLSLVQIIEVTKTPRRLFIRWWSQCHLNCRSRHHRRLTQIENINSQHWCLEEKVAFQSYSE